jgi:hypothetical protein
VKRLVPLPVPLAVLLTVACATLLVATPAGAGARDELGDFTQLRWGGDLQGGEPAHNAALMRDLLGGARGPLRDIVLLNSAAALVVAGKAETLRYGAERAAEAIDSGAARRILDRLVAATNGRDSSG